MTTDVLDTLANHPEVICMLYVVAECAAAITETAYHDDTEDTTRRTIAERDFIALQDALAALAGFEIAAQQQDDEMINDTSNPTLDNPDPQHQRPRG